MSESQTVVLLDGRQRPDLTEVARSGSVAQRPRNLQPGGGG